MRIGVVAVHGVAPLPRYSFEDSFAEELRRSLSAQGKSWNLDSVYPHIRGSIRWNPEEVRLTTDRLTCGADEIEIHEVYWSPLDKNRTTPLSVAAWLLKAAFVPLNNKARFPGGPVKGTFDICYAVGAMLLAAALVIGAFVLGSSAFQHVIGMVTNANGDKPPQAPPSFLDIVFNPLQLAKYLRLGEIAAVIAAVAGVVLIGQAISAILGGALVRHQKDRASWKPERRTTVRIGLVLIAGLALTLCAALFPAAGGRPFGLSVVWLVVGVLFLQGASSIGTNFLVNRLGDVQIYTTADENARFFEIREKIRTLAERILFAVIDRRLPGAHRADSPAYYDKIIVVGYSLGAPIAMDAILRVHEIHEAAPTIIGPGDWGRMRAFITFGCALEKTKFFFSARAPSPSAKREEWNSRLDGHLFTNDRRVLRGHNDLATAGPRDLLGIFWLNLWYWTDIVANEMDTFRSTQPPRIHGIVHGPSRNVCLNQRLPHNFFADPFPHGSYLRDTTFWTGPAQPGATDGQGPIGALEVFTTLLA